MSFKFSQTLIFLASIVIGIFILYPLSDFQFFLSQGDHGRDLYAFQHTISGAKVYKDYWWVYGPLMPTYYSLFDRLLGTNIHSILIGKMILLLLSGLFIYLSMALFFSPLAALTVAIWFWIFNEDFFFTYNHAGGITMIILVVYSIFLYLKNPRIRYLALGLTANFILMLIKLNFGVTAFIVFMSILPFIDHLKGIPITPRKRYFYFWAFVLPFLTFFCYWFVVQGLSVNEIRQCLPYLKGDQPYETSMWQSLQNYLEYTLQNIKSSWAHLAFALLFILSMIQSAYIIFRNKDKNRLLVIAILALFLIVSMHEFLMSGVFYRVFWIRPFQVLFIFTCIFTATQNLSKVIQILLYITILITAFIQFYSQTHVINQIKRPQQYLSHSRGKIFVGNQPQWIDTVMNTTEFLTTHLKKEDTFFALPYDCLYYYLTDKTSPTRQLIFFEHIKIPQEQEEKILQELEKNHVNWVVVSSRMVSPEHGLGILGRTYCPMIGKYLEDHFFVVAQFGNWQNIPGWAWNHGTKILKRKTPL